MPSVRNEPDESEAETSSDECVLKASDSKHEGVLFGASSSYLSVAPPHFDIMRCVSMPRSRSRCRRATANGDPVAPVTPTTMRCGRRLSSLCLCDAE